MPAYPVLITYIDDVQRAEFDCPLCKQHVTLPFTGHRPTPDNVVGSHLGGGTASLAACGSMPPTGTVDVEMVGQQTAVIRVA